VGERFGRPGTSQTLAYGNPIFNTLISRDMYPSFGWHPHRTAVFNLHLLNSKGACELFGSFEPDVPTASTDDVADFTNPAGPLRGFCTAAAPRLPDGGVSM